MPPRRKTRKAAQAEAQAEAEEAENTSQQGDTMSPGPSAASKLFLGTLPDDVDFAALTSILPDISLETVSAENVIACFRVILTQLDQSDAKDKEIDELKAQAERAEVEYDQALQDRESSIKDLETSNETLQSELGRVQKENGELATARNSLQTQLSLLGSNHSTSSVELGGLKRRADDVEREKRDLLGVVARLEEDAASSQEQILQLRETVKASRKECQDLESSIRDLKSSDTSTKFKVETLTQQLKLAREDNERINEELSSKSEQFSAYRREKHAEIVKLQSKHESLSQENNHTVNTLQSLQASHDSQSQQLSQALQKVQDLTSQLADQEAKYSSEAANLRRLNQMMEERDTKGKAIVEGIEKDWEGLGAKAAARELKLRQALEAEEERSAGLESQLEDMKLVVDRINRGELPMPHHAGTPGSLQDLSTGLAMINRMQKTGKTFTEVYADYVRLQDEFVKKTIENERLDQALNNIMAEIEERTPVLTQQRQDFERVQAEAMQLASQLTRAISERDSYAQHVDQLDQKLTKGAKEISLLQQQLVDLGRQVQTLLREISRRDDPSLPPDDELVDMEPSGGVGSIIDNKLVLFRSITDLQEQNVKLLAITRDLGNKLESDEREYKDTLDREQTEAVREAHEAIQMLQSRLEHQQRSSQATIQAYVKECDTLRTMLKRRDVNGAGTSGPLNGQIRQEPADTEKRLRDAEGTFDSFREDISADTAQLREEAMRYQRDASKLGAELAKANAKLEHMNERYRMGQERVASQNNEYENVSKRNRQLQDQYVKLEIASNHLTEELATATSQVEILRNECANLRAEKKIWESIQSRLIEENKILSVERSRLSDLLVNVQKLHNDVDKSYEGDKRRLDSQVQTMETQMQDLRSQLSNERESSRKDFLQKDVELREIRSKLDITSTSLSSTREKLVGAETSRKHLEDRVADLQKQLQTNEEKLTVYERRPPGAPGSASTSLTGHAQSEQDLKAEVAELRGALKAAELDLATARSHVQQFQDISAASEAALAALGTTHEEYKTQSEASIASLESQRTALEQRISALQKDSDSLSEKNKELSKALDEERLTFANDKRTLEDTIFDITNAEKSSATDQTTREGEVREQEQRAKDAEERYSREVVAHAESIKQIETLKNELTDARAVLRDQTSTAETAQAKLMSSEASWLQQRESLNKEISDLDKRCKDLVDQNNTLHQHLDSVTSQASRIRNAADSTANAPADGEQGDDPDGRQAELRSVVSYLRKEKEIVDLQLELSKQEAARQKSQIDHLSKSLDDVRATLSAEREQAARSVENSKEHTEILEKINQLNVLRESNSTLRAESDGHARRARQLQTSLDQLQSELEPVKSEARTARAELEEKNRQIKRLEQENQQWKERNGQLLTKYDRIDPSDVQTLRDEIEDLQIDARKFEEEKANLVKDAEEKAKSLEQTSKALSDFRTKYQGLLNESKNRLGNLNRQIAQLNENSATLTQSLKEVTAERDQLKEAQASIASGESTSAAELAKARTDLETLRAQKESAEKTFADEMQKSAKTISEVNASLAKIQEERDSLLREKALFSAAKTDGGPANVEPTLALQQLESEKAELLKARDEAIGRAEAAQAEANKHLEELKGIRFQNEKFQARLSENEKRKQAEGDRVAALIAKHKQDQEAAVTAATDKLRTELRAPDANAEALVAKHAEELKALEARLVAKHEKELQEEIEKLRQEGSKSAEDLQEALKSATERGRMEANTKIKLKDGMLQKAQQNVKNLEAQLRAWRDAGILPSDAPLLTAQQIAAVQAPPSSASSASKAAASTPVASTSTAAPPAPGTSGPRPSNPSAALPRKPSLQAGSASSVSADSTAGATSSTPSESVSMRGARGGARGLRGAIRGATRGAAPGRGGAPAAAAATAAMNASASTSSAPAGVSIMGAAGKRAREDSDTPDSLAKRIKPADGASKPVALRRDRIPPVNPTPPS